MRFLHLGFVSTDSQSYEGIHKMRLRNRNQQNTESTIYNCDHNGQKGQLRGVEIKYHD